MTARVQVKKLAPILLVDEIEPCLGFWKKLGFEKSVEVPDGERLGFVILANEGVEVMYQTRASVRQDLPSLADLTCSTMLYLDVADLDAVAARLDPGEVVVARRTTFYGAEEIFAREPAGNVVGFAYQPR